MPSREPQTGSSDGASYRALGSTNDGSPEGMGCGAASTLVAGFLVAALADQAGRSQLVTVAVAAASVALASAITTDLSESAIREKLLAVFFASLLALPFLVSGIAVELALKAWLVVAGLYLGYLLVFGMGGMLLMALGCGMISVSWAVALAAYQAAMRTGPP